MTDWTQVIAAGTLCLVAVLAMVGLLWFPGSSAANLPDIFKTVVTVVIGAFAGYLNQQRVNGTAKSLSITPAPSNLPLAKVDQDYSVVFDAHGGTSPYKFFPSGSYPGLTFDATTNALLGKPVQTADTVAYHFTIKATDANNKSVSQDYVLKIQPKT